MIQEGVPRELPKYLQADDEEDHPEKYEGDEKTQRGHTIVCRVEGVSECVVV